MKMIFLLLLLSQAAFAQINRTDNLATVRVGAIHIKGLSQQDSADFYPALRKAWRNTLVALQQEGHYKLMPEGDTTADNIFHLEYALENFGYPDQQTVLNANLESAYSPFVNYGVSAIYHPDTIGKDPFPKNFEEMLNSDGMTVQVLAIFFMPKKEKVPCLDGYHKFFLKPIETQEPIDKQMLLDFHQILLDEGNWMVKSQAFPFKCCFVKQAAGAIVLGTKIERQGDRYRFSLYPENPGEQMIFEREVFVDAFLVEKGLYRPFLIPELGNLMQQFLRQTLGE